VHQTASEQVPARLRLARGQGQTVSVDLR
jgi:hypothetical protein